MTVVLVDIVSRHGIEGMLLAGAMAGAMQLIVGFLRLGNLVKFLPHAVVSGFTNGIAVIIFLSQAPEALRNITVTLVTVGVILLAHRYLRRTIPPSLWGLAAGLLVNQWIVGSPHVVGAIPAALPKVALPFAALGEIGELFFPAVTIFLLGSIEALLSAEIGDMMTSGRHDSNRELIGQGLGNIVSALVGGVPVTGAIARTAVNVKSGARTRLSGMIHSVVLLLVVLVFGRWAQIIPLAALAGILMVTAVRMADLDGLRILPRVHWRYGATLLVTMALTIIQDLTIAVAGGLALAALLAVIDLASPHVSRRPASALLPDHPNRERAEQIQVVSVAGPLYFLGVAKLLRHLESLPAQSALVLDLGAVTHMDESGGMLIKRVADRFADEGRSLYIASAGPQSLRLLTQLGVAGALGPRRVGIDLQTALESALAEPPADSKASLEGAAVSRLAPQP